MTKPFVGRCNLMAEELNTSKQYQLEREILNTKNRDLNTLIDLVKDSKSDSVFRRKALAKLAEIYGECDDKDREIVIALIDSILTYDKSGQPIEADNQLRVTAFTVISTIYRYDTDVEYAMWKNRVAHDPYPMLQLLASLRHNINNLPG